jgi:ubiquitin-like 1-activating enzyme E1 A
VGGVLGQEIIKVISGKEEPLNNFFCYDGIDYRRAGVVETIQRK